MNKLLAFYLSIRTPIMYISFFFMLVNTCRFINIIALIVWLFTLVITEKTFERYCRYRKWLVIKGGRINMKIKGIFHFNDTDFDTFNKHLFENINKLQDDGQEIEVQYKTNTLPNGQIFYSALILGRVI